MYLRDRGLERVGWRAEGDFEGTEGDFEGVL